MTPTSKRYRLSMVAVVLLFAIAARPLAAEIGIPTRFDRTLARKVDYVVSKEMKGQDLVGLAVGVVRDGRIAYVQGYGWEDREAKIEVTRKTRFRWASISKTVTAVAAMLLVEQGSLSLETDVRTLVPEFPDKGERITVRDLLCHQSGIRHYANGRIVPNTRRYESSHPFESVVLAIDEFKDSPLIFQPRSKFSYSTHAYILLSAVVERAADRKFADFVDASIAEPLGMDTFEPDYAWIDIPHRAVGYRHFGKSLRQFLGIDRDRNDSKDSQPRVTRSTDTDVSWKLGGGGFLSNIDDLTRWAAAITRQEILSEDTWEDVATIQTTQSGKRTRYGLGFHIGSTELGATLEHSGAQEKTRTYLLTIPEAGIALVAMTNSEYGKPRQVVRNLLPIVTASRR